MYIINIQFFDNYITITKKIYYIRHFVYPDVYGKSIEKWLKT